MCAKICQSLNFFNDATKTLSGIYYPITNLFITKSLNIIRAFDKRIT